MNFEIVKNFEDKTKCMGVLRYKGDINSIEFLKFNEHLSIIGVINFDNNFDINKEYIFRYCQNGFDIIQKKSVYENVLQEITNGYIKNLDFINKNVTFKNEFQELNKYIYSYDLSNVKPEVPGIHSKSYSTIPFYGMRYGFLCCGIVVHNKNNSTGVIKYCELYNNNQELLNGIRQIIKKYIRKIFPDSADIYDTAKILLALKTS